jgi:hypothetical protein
VKEQVSMVEQIGGPKPGSSRTRWLLSAGLLVVAALVAVLLVFTGKSDSAVAGGTPVPSSASSTQSVAAPVVQGLQSQIPGVVTLPGGGTAKLVKQELTADGTLPIPQSLGEAAWWGADAGAAQGAMLLSGHVNWKGQKGPFDELWRVKDGQEVDVVDVTGGKWVYKISDIVTIDKSKLDQSAPQLFGQDGPHRLVLVTCGGEYVGGSEGYDENRIVSADLVSHP